jgi:hypothetical protein
MAAGCGTTHDPAPSSGSAVSSVTAALSGGVFDGNSVFITAHRDGFADGKYPCVSKASGCFNFGPNSQGVPTANDPNVANEFDNLCPTEDVNSSDAPGTGLWTFTYKIWSQPDCTGEVITGQNFDCFAESDLATQQNPNQTANEDLQPGQVVNTVICTSVNTEKSFDFNSCSQLVISPPNPPLPPGDEIFNCGCTRTGTAACTCPWFDPKQPGVNTPPPGCQFDEDCNLDCTGVPGSDGGVCACDFTYLPVTCSNGVTYPNICVANCAGQTQCNPVCACDFTFLPVTCSNGNTYANLCVATCEGATGCSRTCGCDDTFIPVTCDFNGQTGVVFANQCAADCAGATNCVPTFPAPDGGACACPFTFLPVTCSNGVTYANQCVATCNGQSPSMCASACACPFTFLPVVCDSDGKTYANQCAANCAGATGCNRLCACPFTFIPVICSDGNTYANQCVADCRGATGCTVINGPLPDGGLCACDLTFNPVVCDLGSETGVTFANPCLANCAGATNCVPLFTGQDGGPCACPFIFLPVTCENGVTYANQCVATCNGQSPSMCQSACACPFTFLPVVCSDGNTYANQCVANCRGATGCKPIGNTCACDDTFIPVTCSDGNTYANLCTATCVGATGCQLDP